MPLNCLFPECRIQAGGLAHIPQSVLKNTQVERMHTSVGLQRFIRKKVMFSFSFEVTSSVDKLACKRTLIKKHFINLIL